MEESKIKRMYLNPSVKGSFAGLNSFMKNNPTLKKDKVEKVLRTIPTYAENVPALRRFPRRRVIVPGIDEQWAGDLIDISKYSKWNNNHTFLFCLIDILSKFAFVEPIKSKKSEDTLKAFKKILKYSGRKPRMVQVDKGNEFKGSYQAFCDAEGIKIFHVESELKASVIERFQRTLMERISRYVQHKNNYKFVHVLPDIVRKYNQGYHRSIKMSPKDVDKRNEMQVWKTLYGDDQPKDTRKAKFNVGDKVLISIDKNRYYTKGYTRKFKPEVFTIERVGKTNPRMYYLTDGNESLSGGFYSHELSKVYYDKARDEEGV
jgi:hypothetical protein